MRQVPKAGRSESTHTTVESGTDDVTVCKAPVSTLVTNSLLLNYFRTCATQIYFWT